MAKWTLIMKPKWFDSGFVRMCFVHYMNTDMDNEFWLISQNNIHMLHIVSSKWTGFYLRQNIWFNVMNQVTQTKAFLWWYEVELAA